MRYLSTRDPARSPAIVRLVGRPYRLHTRPGFRYLSLSTPNTTTAEDINRALQPTDLLALYRGLVARGDIKHDEDQIRAVMRLRRLSKSLEVYVPNLISGHAVPAITPPGTSWWTPHHKLAEESSITPSTESKALLRRKDARQEMEDLPFPKGLILIAPPGRGKTFLLDLWFSSLPTKHKVRKHYSTLVLEMYRAVWEETQHRAKAAQAQRQFEARYGARTVKWTAELKRKWKSLLERGIWDQQPTEDAAPSSTTTHISPLPISQILAARLLLRQGWLLHIDELQLLDIGSATILSDVLFHFWKMGVGGALDWRREDEESTDGKLVDNKGKPRRTWFVREQKDDFDRAVEGLVQGREPVPTTLNIFSRRFVIPKTYLPTNTAPPTAQFAFDELCNTALGSADYTTLASTFPTLIITDIPILKLVTKDRARRFISLIDALYEARVKIICIAEAEIDGLPNVSTYQPVNQTQRTEQEVKKSSSGAEGLSLKELSIFTGQEEKFAYARATSRLVQMTSPKYAENAIWQPLTRAQQPWHVDTPFAHSSNQGQIPKFAADDQVAEKDWAEEASYDARRSRKGRPEPPRLSENHAWGVRDDWGKRDGDWGKGPGKAKR
ncbi:hypothetical protein OPQ81_010607 [Rhizoctonia solani]|nr:hypothetical protein OPQ81_010607 [Rhizoctonia solani]